jgi:hypothetical protein
MPETQQYILRLDRVQTIGKPHLTAHAHRRMGGRWIRTGAIEAVLDYGRIVYTRGAVIHAIGRNEIDRYARDGIDLAAYNGIQVVCSLDGMILTVYRNKDFRGLRTGMGRGRHNRLKRA